MQSVMVGVVVVVVKVEVCRRQKRDSSSVVVSGHLGRRGRHMRFPFVEPRETEAGIEGAGTNNALLLSPLEGRHVRTLRRVSQFVRQRRQIYYV